VFDMITMREHRVAIATEDGKHIASHFRAAPIFVIYTVRQGKFFSAETRVNALAAIPAEIDCNADCWKVVDDVLGDVRVVICSGMGENAYVGLLRRDILPLLTDEKYTDRALDEYLRGRLREQPELVHARNDYDDNCLTDQPLKLRKEGGEQ
jgi:predicted Fe-Mo cluster-binding NifX family protein